MNFPPRTALSGLVPQTLLEGREGGSSIRFQKPPKFNHLLTTCCIHDSECLTHAITKTNPEVLERDLESPIQHGQSSGCPSLPEKTRNRRHLWARAAALIEAIKPFLFLSLLFHLSSFSSSLLFTSTHPCILGLWLLQRCLSVVLPKALKTS